MNPYAHLLIERKPILPEGRTPRPRGGQLERREPSRPWANRWKPKSARPQRASRDASLQDEMGPTYAELAAEPAPWYQGILDAIGQGASAIVRAKTSAVVAKDAATMRASGYPIPPAMYPYATNTGPSMGTLALLAGVGIGAYLLLKK